MTRTREEYLAERKAKGWFWKPDYVKSKRGCVSRSYRKEDRKELAPDYMSEEGIKNGMSWRGIYNKREYEQMRKEMEMRK